MELVSSLSGGKTSSYLAVHYPAKYELFSVVLIDDPLCAPKDKGLVRTVSDKLGIDFIATAEDDKTLRVMLDLEQLTGRNIIWLHGDSFDEVIRKRMTLPNKFQRFCTTEMKLKPIFEYCFSYVQDFVSMQIGFRYDELDRASHFTTEFKYQSACNLFGIRGYKWKTIEWREGNFPMIRDKIINHNVKEYWRGKGLLFPDDSNCVNCFWKSKPQLTKNTIDNPPKMRWASRKETEMGGTFKKEFSYDSLFGQEPTQPFDWMEFGEGAACVEGNCHD